MTESGLHAREGELPTGAVTFLFTDIEGSTRMAEHLGSAFGELLDTHHRLLGEAVVSHRGLVVNTQGDAFFAVFPAAADALAAAVAAQRALAAERWTGGVELRVRMGMHSGEAVLGGADYVGLAVHRAARVAGLAYGGQVLVSEATRRGADPELPVDVSFTDLGLHRLKDLTEPERIHQLVHPGLSRDFPALRSLDAFRHNLPVAATSFVGREAEVTDLAKHLAEARLVTLLGPGGSGKTRLALQVAAERVDQHGDGVWLAELAPWGDPALVPAAVAAVLGVREEPGKSLLESLESWVAGREVLVVLDNCEHVVAAAADLAGRLLRAGPGVRVLATSREALGVAAEQVVTVPPLRLPDPAAGASSSLEALFDSEAVRLFVERARSARSDLELGPEHAAAVIRICTRLDGIPLALELAARRVRALSLSELADRLDQRLRFLTGGAREAEARHQTLRAAIDWSHDLLEADERILFRRLGVFAGGFDLAAAETVCAGPYDTLDLIVALVDKSLVVASEASGVTRYRMLETIREYALERLAEAREDDATRQAHLAWALHVVERGAPPRSRGLPRDWVDHLDVAHDNLRVALDHAQEHDPEAGLRLAAALRPFWWVRGHWHEGRVRLEAALARTPGTAPALRAKGLVGAADLAEWQGDLGPATALAEEARQIFRRSGDRPGEAECCWKLGNVAMMRGRTADARALLEEGVAISRDLPGREHLAELLNALGCLALDEGDFAAARHCWEETLATDPALSDAFVGGPGSHARYNLAMVLCFEGAYPAARELAEESLERGRVLGDASLAAGARGLLGEIALYEGDFATSRSLLEESLELQRKLGEATMVAGSQLRLGRLALARGDLLGARALLEEALRRERELDGKWGRAAALRGLGVVARQEQRYGEARAALEESLALFDEMCSRDDVMTNLGELGELALAEGDLTSARALLEDSLDQSRALGVQRETACRLEALGRLALAEGDLDRAARGLADALALALALGARPVAAEAAEALAAAVAAAGDLQRAARLLGAASSLRESMGAALLPSVRIGHDATWAAVQKGLGPEEAGRAVADGRGLALDELAAP
jgi:predicted ATPase/class 3 adenylate cyclase